jgi:hypothetical protein
VSATTACFDASSGDRRGVHHVTATAHEQQRKEGPHAVDDAVEVDAQCPVPQLDRPGPRVTHRCHPGVVAHDMHCAESLHRRRGQRVHGLGVTNVGLHRQRLDTNRTDGRGGGGKPGLVDIGQHHVQTSLRESVSHRQTDPAGRSRHHRDLSSFQLHVIPCRLFELLRDSSLPPPARSMRRPPRTTTNDAVP